MQVRADLHTHKGEAKVFFKRAVALDRDLVLLCRAGPDTQKLRGTPVPSVFIKVKCHSRDFRSTLYQTDSSWRAARVLEAIRCPLAALIVTLLRLNHPESDLVLFLKKETFVNVLRMTRTMLEKGSLTAGRLGDLVVIPLEDDGTPDYVLSFECRRRGEHSLTDDPVPLPLRLEQAIDATTSAAALEMCRRAAALSEEGQTQLAAQLATTSAQITLPGAFA